ncbi:MAG: hypothetical protein KBT11_08730 [Treponema sp.]|nr:hypothetical protein [Candidatus Treponema equifaecale]
MKKIRLLLTAVAFSFLTVFTGCSDVAEGSVSDSVPYSYTGVISGAINNFSEVDPVARNAASRTIMPNEAVTETLDYYLYGKSASGTEYPFTKLTVEDNGKFSVKMDSGVWDFTLVAVTTGTTAPTLAGYLTSTDAKYVGFALGNLLKSSDVTFTLSAAELQARVKVTFDVNLKDEYAETGAAVWDLPSGSLYDVVTKIVNPITNDIIYNKAGNTVSSNKFTLNTDTTTIAPGTYNFIVEFVPTDAGKAKGLKSAIWSDILIVVANRTTYKEINVPNIIGTKPQQPESLAAYLVMKDVANGIPAADLAGHEDFFKVRFDWSALAVNNERYFDLEIATLTNEALAIKDGNSDWESTSVVSRVKYSAVADTAKSVIAVREDSAYVSGSLLANNTTLDLYLKSGACYSARIRAVNDNGESDWTYLTLPTGKNSFATTTFTAYSDALKAAKNKQSDTTVQTKLGEYITALKDMKRETATDIAYFVAGAPGTIGDSSNAEKTSTCINLVRIKYWLNGGSYKDSTSTITADKTVYYISKSNITADISVHALWAANGDELKRGDAEFSGWSTDANELATTNVYLPVKATDTKDKACVAISGYAKTSDDAVEDMVTALESATSSTALEAEDDGGYQLITNLDLFADYTGNLEGLINLEDDIADYKLYAHLVEFKGSEADAKDRKVVEYWDGTDICDSGATSTKIHYPTASTSKFTVSKASIKGSSNSVVTFKITVPSVMWGPASDANKALGYVTDVNKTWYCKDTADNIAEPTGDNWKAKADYKTTDTDFKPAAKLSYAKENYDSIVFTVRAPDGEIKHRNPATPSALGSATQLAAFDPSKWENKSYIINIVATKKLSGRTITRSIALTMELTD